jgi:hypothetical protein
MRRPRLSFALAALVLLASVAVAWAKTPDGQTPSEETVCDNETGAAFGLCNAYCEAMDCDSPNHRASDNACAAVKRNFEKKTGRPLPCEVTCPCAGLLPLFETIEDTVVRCVADDSFVFLRSAERHVAVVEAGPPPTCSVDAQPPFVQLTPAEHQVCRVELLQAAAARGVQCTPPE